MRTQGTRNHVGGWTLISEPSGDFTPGATFCKDEFAATLRMGNWQPGAIFERRGKRFEVVVICDEFAAVET